MCSECWERFTELDVGRFRLEEKKADARHQVRLWAAKHKSENPKHVVRLGNGGTAGELSPENAEKALREGESGRHARL